VNKSILFCVGRLALPQPYFGLVALAVLAMPGSLGATVIYSNLAFPSSGPTFTGVNSTTWAANSFSTGGSSSTLTDVILSLEGVSTTGSLSVSIYSDSSNAPGSNLVTLGTIQDSALSTSSFTQQTVNGGNFALAANTTYFIVLSGSTAGSFDADWEKASGGSGTGVTGQEWGTTSNSGTTWSMHGISVDLPPYVMQVDASSGTPEPGTVYGVLGGLFVLGGVRRRAQRKSDSGKAIEKVIDQG
jgi:hypothetical protein